MNRLLRALIAGYGARTLGQRMGCGCIGTVILFIILYELLRLVFH